MAWDGRRIPLHVATGDGPLTGEVHLPRHGRGLVVAYPQSALDWYVVRFLRERRIGTLVPDGIPGPLGAALVVALDWASDHPDTGELAAGLYGAGAAVSAVVEAASLRPTSVAALVLRHGAPIADPDRLPRIRAPLLLIREGPPDPGGPEPEALLSPLRGERRVETVTDPLPSPERIARAVHEWMEKHLRPAEAFPLRAGSWI